MFEKQKTVGKGDEVGKRCSIRRLSQQKRRTYSWDTDCFTRLGQMARYMASRRHNITCLGVVNTVGISERLCQWRSIKNKQFANRSSFLYNRGRAVTSREDEEEEPVWKRRRRCVFGRVSVRLRCIWDASMAGQRLPHSRGETRQTGPLEALFQVPAQSSGIGCPNAVLRRMQMGLRSVHGGLLRYPGFPLAPIYDSDTVLFYTVFFTGPDKLSTDIAILSLL